MSKFLSKTEEYPIVGINRVLFSLSSIGGHLGGFHLLAVANTLLRTWVCKYLFKHLLSILLGTSCKAQEQDVF